MDIIKYMKCASGVILPMLHGVTDATMEGMKFRSFH
jgi:hypothetical protein